MAPLSKKPKRSRDSAVSSSISNQEPRPEVLENHFKRLKPSPTNQEPQVQETSVQKPNVLEPIQEPNLQVPSVQLPVQDRSVSASNVLQRVPQHSDPKTESGMSELVYDPGLRPSIYSYARNGKGLENIRKAYLFKGPSQPKDHAFKKTDFPGKSLAFNPKWYAEYANWLEYSTSKDAIFCLYCYLFKPENDKQSGGGTFATKGFKNWKKATETLKEHVGMVNSSHNKCYFMCRDLLNSKVPPHSDPQTESNMSELVYDPGLRPSIYSYARVGKGLNNIRKAYLLKGPSQPKDHAFKETFFPGSSRAFNPEWYTKYANWLEYSTSEDGIFCLFCYLFKPNNGRRGGTFVTKGFNNWKRATVKLKAHVGKVNSSHNKCYVLCRDLLNSKQHIDRTLAKVKPSQIKQEPQVEETTVQEPNMLEQIQVPNFQLPSVQLPVENQSVPISNVLPKDPQHSDPQTDSMSELVYDPGLRPSIYSYARDGKGLENIRKAYLLKGPSQPNDHTFKRTDFWGKSRAFNPEWYAKYANWLEYSTSKDAIFCLYCYLFKPENDKQSGGGTFATKGFKNWYNATNKLRAHVGKVNSSHNKCYFMSQDLLNSKQHIDRTLAKVKPSQIKQEPQVEETTVQEPNMLEQIQEPNFQVPSVQLPVENQSVPTSNVLPKDPQHSDPQTNSMSELVYDPGLRPSIYSYARDEKGLENIRKAYLLKGPSQPKDYAFKNTNFSGKSLAFNPEWYKKYANWLEYSTSKDGIFCLFCYLFKPENGEQGGGGTFVTKGFKNWKKATEKLKEHVGEVNSSHNKCYVMCLSLLNKKQQIDRTLAKVSDRK